MIFATTTMFLGVWVSKWNHMFSFFPTGPVYHGLNLYTLYPFPGQTKCSIMYSFNNVHIMNKICILKILNTVQKRSPDVVWMRIKLFFPCIHVFISPHLIHEVQRNKNRKKYWRRWRGGGELYWRGSDVVCSAGGGQSLTAACPEQAVSRYTLSTLIPCPLTLTLQCPIYVGPMKNVAENQSK